MPATQPQDPNAAGGGLRRRVEGSPYNSGILFLVIGIILLGVGGWLAELEHLYRTQGRETEAFVVRTWGTGAKANTQYRFTLPDGRELTSTQGRFRAHSDRLRVEYVATHPGLSRVAGQEHRAYITLLFLGVLALALGVRLVRQSRRGETLGFPQRETV